MHSQSSVIQTVACVESQASRPSAANIIATKSANNQIVAMTKRKQNLGLAHQSKSSSTTDLTVVNVMNKITNGTPTINGNLPSAINHVALKTQTQINTVRQQLSRAVMPARVSPNNGRTDIGDEQILSYQSYQRPAITPSYTSTPANVSMSISSPQISTPHANYHNAYAITNYPSQVQIQQPCNNEIGNRHNYSNRNNNSNGNNNQKIYNPKYPKSKRNGPSSNSNNSSTTSSMKAYNNSSNNNNNYSKNNNNNNNNNNNEYERNAVNKSNGQHASQPIIRNSNVHRSFNSDTSNNISPSRDHYSSSSSSSSTSSVPLNKKRDSRTESSTFTFDRIDCCRPWSCNQYVENGHSTLFSYDWFTPDGYPIGRSMQQYTAYTNPSTGEFVNVTNVVDGNKSNHRVNRSHRANHKNVHNAKRYTPPDRFMNRAAYVEMKEPPVPLKNGSRFDRLSMQVWERFVMCQQKTGTYTKKIKMWKNMFCTVQQSFPGYQLIMVGSTISGFGSDVADVHMCLLDETKTGQMYFGGDLRQHSVNILKDFEALLRENPIYGEFHLIPAKVPILRFKDTFHEFEIDLNYNNYVGIQNTHLMHGYASMDWRLRPLALVVKIWAQFHGINNAKEMTISSYSLLLMVIHFLQCGTSPPVLPCLHDLHPNKFQKHQEIKNIDMHEDLAPWYSQNKQTLGELFFGFFEYYTKFDFANKAISVRKGCVVSIESCQNNYSPKNDPNQWKELCIEEPFDYTNTAHSCYDPYKFQWIRRVFKQSYEALDEHKNLKTIFEKSFMPIMP